MGKIQSNISLADVTAHPVSKETGFVSIPYNFSSTQTTTIWEAIDLDGTYGTVVIIGDKIKDTASMNIAVNGMNTTTIIDDETFAMSSNPLEYVDINYTSPTGEKATVSISISASKFAY